MALSLLVASTGLSGRGVTETLTYLSRLKYEQDPVRREVLRALEAISGLYTSEHIPFLETLVTDALEARDTSEATRTALRVLTFEILRAHLMDHRGALFQFALRTMERLLGLAAETREEPLFAQALAAMVASVMKLANEECAPELLLDVAARVRTGAPLVALELVREAGTRRYWRGAEARNLLRELRQHPRPAVRVAARAVTVTTG
jgi:hypothetical protein